MPHASRLDLRYEHEVRAAPSSVAAIASPPLFEGRGLVARLRSLKVLMDEERGHFAAWIAARPTVVPS